MPAPSEINLDGNVLQLYTYEQVDMDKKKAGGGGGIGGIRAAAAHMSEGRPPG